MLGCWGDSGNGLLSPEVDAKAGKPLLTTFNKTKPKLYIQLG